MKTQETRIMRVLPIIGIISILLITAAGCDKKTERKTRGEEDRLYSESVALIKRYTDSLAATTDSTQIHNLMTHFQDRLDKINNGVSPETDMLMSEGQNDTLAELVAKLLETRDKSLKGPETAEHTDTIPSDTLSQGNNTM